MLSTLYVNLCSRSRCSRRYIRRVECYRAQLLWHRWVSKSRQRRLQHSDLMHRDAFCLFYNAEDKTVKALNGSGRAPAKLTIDYAISRGMKGRIPLTDLNSVTVPGWSMTFCLVK